MRKSAASRASRRAASPGSDTGAAQHFHRGDPRRNETCSRKRVLLSVSEQLSPQDMRDSRARHEHGTARKPTFNGQLSQRLSRVAQIPNDFNFHDIWRC
jgi:hypothetical protein